MGLLPPALPLVMGLMRIEVTRPISPENSYATAVAHHANRCQAKFLTSAKLLTCYCLSVILLLRKKVWQLLFWCCCRGDHGAGEDSGKSQRFFLKQEQDPESDFWMKTGPGAGQEWEFQFLQESDN